VSPLWDQKFRRLIENLINQIYLLEVPVDDICLNFLFVNMPHGILFGIPIETGMTIKKKKMKSVRIRSPAPRCIGVPLYLQRSSPFFFSLRSCRVIYSAKLLCMPIC